MGDHRAEIHVTFKIHGKTYRLDLDWVNYFVEDDGIDYRVVNFFRQSWDDALGRYREKIHSAEKEADAKRLEATERAELSRLRAKYETIVHSEGKNS